MFSFLIVLIVLLATFDKKVLSLNICTEDFCSAYRESPKCEILADHCRIQNQTHNGLIFPSATPCACCEVCIENQKLGDDCSIGSPSLPIPNAICGPGLYCFTKGKDHPTCQPMSSTSKCFTQQDKFDADSIEGMVGHLEQRPQCDGDGNFERIVCVPGQNCFCIDEAGHRIFGDAVFRSDIKMQMKCECSRLHHKLKNMIDQRFPLFSTRCNALGSFDELQCFDDLCVCVDPQSGSPTSDTRNITLGLAGLPCFNKKVHQNSTYPHDCETIKRGLVNSMRDYELEGFQVLDLNINLCDPDGNYSPVQETDLLKFCADKNGTRIEEFVVSKNSAAGKEMNCKCAVARKLLRDNRFLEIPECCTNGNYKKIACRRGQCYCVDDNGNQVTLEVNADQKHTLECFKEVC